MSDEKPSAESETLAILSDPGLLARLKEAEREFASGGGHDLEEVRSNLRGQASDSDK